MITLLFILKYCFLASAGVSNAIMDKTKSLSDWKNSRWANLPVDTWWYKWAGPPSHGNKWKDGKKKNGPRFWQSHRFLVFVTDAWHFFQAMWRRFLMASLPVYAIGFFLRNNGTETYGMIHFGINSVLWGNILNVTADVALMSITYLMGFWFLYYKVLNKKGTEE